MSDLLWQKPGVTVDARIQAFLAGDDVLLDREFFLHDIAASGAHAEGLQQIGIIDAEELDGLRLELAVLAEDFFAGLRAAGGDPADPASLAAWMQPDGIHPNPDGVKLIVEGLGPKVQELLARVGD